MNIDALLHNEWIKECLGAWGSMIVLAQKPHQESIKEIKEFIWRMCVSYRKLNSITEPFQYPIPRCDDSVTIVGIQVGGKMFFISLDAKQGYHQIRVKEIDQEKLAFFAPNGKKYTFTVMPFGPTNAPSFYTCMMNDFQSDWTKLFYGIVRKLTTFHDEPIQVLSNDDILISRKRIVIGSKIIIDDILLYSTHEPLLLLYLDCICRTFEKYRCSFQLKKCEFLKDRVEYVGHDLTSEGNCPAQSKFDLITDWPTPIDGQSLHSFIGLLNFYHKYIPYMELKLKPLRALERKYRRGKIPQLAWTVDLLSLFSELKIAITSSPLLARYDPAKPTFIKTDWCALGMAWIIMQPDDSTESKTATQLLLDKGICNFDLAFDGARLKPIAYGSRACTDTESHFHSFVGEVCSGRWGFAKNRRYLWGNKFWWLCDCNAVREVLDYSGTIHMISRWAQELLGYDFEVVHRSATMMRDVDSMTRRYGEQYATHLMIAASLRAMDIISRPLAYCPSKFPIRPTRIKHTNPLIETNIPPFTASNLASLYSKQLSTTVINPLPQPNEASVALATNPVRIMYTKVSTKDEQHAHSATYSTASCLPIHIVAIDDITHSCEYWSNHIAPPPFSWSVTNIVTSTIGSNVFQNSRFASTYIPFNKLSNTVQDALHPILLAPIHIIDFTFIPSSNGHIFEWLKEVTFLISKASRAHNTLLFCSAWINETYLPPNLLQGCNDAISYHLPSNWTFTINTYFSTDSLDPIIAKRCCIAFTHNSDCCKPFTDPILFHTDHDFIYYPPFDSITASNLTLANNTNILPLNLDTEDLIKIPIPELCTKPRHIASIKSSNSITNVYDPFFRIPEDSIMSPSSTFQPGIIVASDISQTYNSRLLTIHEILQLYSVPTSFIHQLSPDPSDLPSSLIQSTTPFNLRSAFFSHTLSHGGIQDKLLYSDDTHHDSIQCYFVRPIPTPSDWYNAYINDLALKPILTLLNVTKMSTTSSIAKPLLPKDIKHIKSCYQQYLLSGQLSYSSGRLTAYRTIPLMNRTIALIVVPDSLTHTIFSHYHASPSGGHCGEYKTLYRIRLRFLWAGMRENIKSWVKSCAACVAANAWRTRRSELYFSWPVTLPFWIMHVDLWSPGNTEIKGKKGYLLNSLCDLTQFAISSVTYNITALELSQLFMSDVVLSFGMCAVVVVDAGSTFKGIFEEMCKILDITYWVLARGNHKGNGAERYHRYLNKVQTIEGNNIGTNTNFMRIAKTTQYAWNSSPIDGTDIVRSIAAVGREFRFPLDVKLSELPPLNDKSNNALYNYLRDVSTESTFAISILQILIEERRLMHQTRLNKTLTASSLKVNDIVKAHVQVQSNSATGTVEKLSYKARGPFRITASLGFDSFEVQDYHNPSGAKRKYKSTELYILPPSLYPCEPLDTMDHRYLHYEHAPTVSPLLQPLHIEAYNQEWFDTKPTLPLPLAPVIEHKSITSIDKLAFLPHVPTIDELNQDTSDTQLFEPTIPSPYPLPTIEHQSIITIPSIPDLTNSINLSTDKLIFIQYTPENTLRPKWFLVQVDMDLTLANDVSFASTGIYVCSFLARHPSDITKTDERSRWWPDWYSYTCQSDGTIIYGKRVLFRPNIIPDSSKYILWATPLPLHSPHHYLIGPFNFCDISSSYRTRNTVDPSLWTQLHALCLSKHLHPPTVGTQTLHKSSSHQTNKKKRKTSPVHGNA